MMDVPEKFLIAIEALEKIRLGEEFVFDDEMQFDVPVAMSAEEMQEIAEEVLMQIDNESVAQIWNDDICTDCGGTGICSQTERQCSCISGDAQ